jgi:hypothetical protein
VILFEMLTGRAPVPGAGVPSAVNPLLPREVDPIVGKALGKSGGYESAATLAAELRAMGAALDARKEATVAAPPAAVVVRAARSSPRASAPRWLRAALLLGVLAAIAWWYFRSA